MRSMSGLAAILVLLATVAPPAEAQRTFEGVITYDMTAAGTSMEMKQMAKGMKIRSEMEGPMGEAISLMDVEAGEITTIMPAQRMYMTMDVDAMMQQMPAQHEPPRPEEFEATGRTETIAGHECEHYTYTNDAMTADICIAEGLGFMPIGSPGAMGGGSLAADMEAWQARFPDGFLPLSMEMTSQGNTMTMRATAVEQTSLSDDLFVVPEGYTRMPGGPGGAPLR